MKGTFYEELRPFELLPGHRALLLSLPEFINSSRPANRLANRRQSNFQSGDHNHIENNVDLEDALIKKLESYASKRNLHFEFTKDNITNFRLDANSNEHKCSVKCYKCTVLVPCVYITHWSISNLIKHIKKKHSDQLCSNNNNQQNENIPTEIITGNERRLLIQNQIENMRVVFTD